MDIDYRKLAQLQGAIPNMVELLPPEPGVPSQEEINALNAQANQVPEIAAPQVPPQPAPRETALVQPVTTDRLESDPQPVEDESPLSLLLEQAGLGGLASIFNSKERMEDLRASATEQSSNYDRLKQMLQDDKMDLTKYMPDISGGANMLNFLFKTNRYGKGYKRPIELQAEKAQLNKMKADQIMGLNEEQRKILKSKYGEDPSMKALISALIAKDKQKGNQGFGWDKKNSDDLYKMQKELSGPLQDVRSNLEAFDRLLPKKGENIPGVGPFDRLTPQFMQTPRGIQLVQQVQSLISAIGKKNSGLTLTEAEMNRLLIQLGQASTSPETALLPALDRIREELINTVRSKTAGFRPVVVETYRKQGGYNQSDIEKIPSFMKRFPKRESVMTDAQKARREELLRKSEGR